jgi:membrane-associated protease RseP (regulator of RpoE activity)
MLFQPEVQEFLLVVIFFWLLINLLDRIIHLEQFGIKISFIFIKYESKRFRDLLYRSSQKGQRAWNFFSNLSVVLGAGLLGFAIYFLLNNIIQFVQPEGNGSPVIPILPGLTIHITWLPYFILAFLVAAFTHEAAHGIVARLEGIGLKSAGLFFLLVQPGGFVEPDEEDLRQASVVSKMRVLSAGSSMNLLVGFLVFLVLTAGFYEASSGIVIMEVLTDGPLEQAGLQRWDTIFAINGSQIASSDELNSFMVGVVPGEKLVLSTNRGEVPITASSHPSIPGKAIIGLTASMPYHQGRLSLGVYWDTQIYILMSWMFLVLINLAVINMLPIPFLDGDRFLRFFLQGYIKKDEWLGTFFNGVSLFLLVANMALTLEHGLLSV